MSTDKEREYQRQYRLRNKEKRKQYSKEHHAKNPDARRSTIYKNKFGISLDTYNEMLEQQGGVCAICKQEEVMVDKRTNQVRRLAVDHDHTCCPSDKSCGKCVRGLLCHKCNTFLGHYELLKTLVPTFDMYLQRHTGSTPNDFYNRTCESSGHIFAYFQPQERCIFCGDYQAIEKELGV